MQNLGLIPRGLTLLLATTSLAFANDDDKVVGPGPSPLDPFHPDRETTAQPLYGGRVIVHLASLPESICYPIENSAVTRRLLYECHEFLMIQDWEHHDHRPRVAESWVTEDLLIVSADTIEKWTEDGKLDEMTEAGLVDVRVKRTGEIKDGQSVHVGAKGFYGQVSEGGGSFTVTPASDASALKAEISIAAGDVERVERGCVFTFKLREGVLWHPSVVFPNAEKLKRHAFDAHDIKFSWSIYANKTVNCDEKRFQFEKITNIDVIDDLNARIFYEGQYAFATDSIGTSLTLLPQHIYDLSDPDNPEHREHFTAEEQGKFINENPHNQLWVGLGPYRITQWEQQYVQAERFTDENGKCLYFDRDNAGYFDTIRWRYIDDDETAMNAVLNGELDFFERVKPEDYFGGRADRDLFRETHYKGYKYLGIYGYTGFNMYQPQLKDLAVRKAIIHAFDFETYRINQYKGLARQITGPFPYNSGAYNHNVAPLEYDIDLAYDLLEDAGWYDRDGDGIRDKDGVALELDFMMPSGNDASKAFGLKLQESLDELEIKVNIVQMEWATFLEKLKDRQFDMSNLAWVPPLESDPEQLWHSKWGEYDKKSSNNSGVMDANLDAMIARGQRELDYEKRMAIWHEMHSYIYANIMPYMFMYNVPQKYAMNKKIRGFQAVAIDPGYIIRRWHYTGGEGLRTSLDK